MTASIKQDLLRQVPSIGSLLDSVEARTWLDQHPRPLVADCLRQAVDELRRQIQDDTAGRCGAAHVRAQSILARAADLLEQRTRPHLRAAINATGIVLHTGLGRSMLPGSVVDSMAADMKGYVTLAVDRDNGLRSDRDRRVEYILTELTGAEAATVVNNNAAATMLVLAALTAGRQVVVSRGQLIEIGGSFRLPDVMSLSGAQLVEVGTTNRTHLRDYQNAIGESTAALLKVHTSNYRIVGFTSEVPIGELAVLAHSKGLIAIDDLGGGALIDLEQFHLPHEPTVGESIRAGADIALFSADKLIGASQGGIIVGRRELIDRIRKHPLARACRVDKTCLMALERTLHMFRDVELLKREHPLYRMLSTSAADLQRRAESLAAAIKAGAPAATTSVQASVGYLGSGSLPAHELPTYVVNLSLSEFKSQPLARALRLDDACIFTRVENDHVLLDVRTIGDKQIPQIAAAVGRIASGEQTGRE